MSKIKDYRDALRFAGAPEIVIKYPKILIGKEPTEAQIKWAKDCIKRYKKNKRK